MVLCDGQSKASNDQIYDKSLKLLAEIFIL